MIKLSIVILSWNTKELLRQCLESVVDGLQPMIYNPEGIKDDDEEREAVSSRLLAEIIVVDNGSTDGSVEVAQNAIRNTQNDNLKFKIIENKENLGFAKGNNLGIKAAGGEYVMLLNSDTIVKEGAIETLVNFLDRVEPSQDLALSGETTCLDNSLDRDHPCHQNLAVSPLLILPDGQPQADYYMRFPNLWQIFLYHNPVLRPVVMKIPFLNMLIAQKNQGLSFEVDQLPGAALIVHKDVWRKVGLLDEDYHFLFEDVDWCWRAKKAGIKLMVVPEAKVIHIGGASWKKKLKENSGEFYYQFFSSMLLFIRKNYGGWSATVFNWAIISNFILALKPLLAWRFLRGGGAQKEFLG